MKTIKKITLLVVIASILTIFSCTKEGKEGPAGPAGASGTNGTNGNANVKSILLSTSTWYWDNSFKARYYTWYPSELTYDIASTGAVFLYQSTSSGAGFIQLPISQPVSASVVESDFFEYGENIIEVYIQNSNQSDPISQIPIPTYYKLVLIPSSARIANPNVDYTNYEEVKTTFNLKD